MSVRTHTPVDVSQELVEAIRSFPAVREVEHCNKKFQVSPFELYADCPDCGTRIKVRSLSGAPEIEDVFDAVFEWLNDPETRKVADRRQKEIAEDADE